MGIQDSPKAREEKIQNDPKSKFGDEVPSPSVIHNTHCVGHHGNGSYIIGHPP